MPGRAWFLKKSCLSTPNYGVGGRKNFPLGAQILDLGWWCLTPCILWGGFGSERCQGETWPCHLCPRMGYSLFFVPSDGLFPFLCVLGWVILSFFCLWMSYSPFFRCPCTSYSLFFRASAPRPRQDPALLHEAFVTRAQGPFETRPRCPGERGSCLAVPIFPQWCLFSLESEGVCALCPAPAPGAKPDLCCSLSAPRKEGKKKGDFCVENNL